MRFSGTPPNFPLAFLVAPLAAGLVAGTIMVLMILPSMTEMDLAGLWAAGFMTALVVSLISALYTAVIGGATAFHHHRTGRVPSAKTAVMVGLLAWLIPFGLWYITMFVGAFALPEANAVGDALLLVVISLAAAMAAAASCWLVGVRGREPR